MLDKKSISVLKVLNKLSMGSAYKVITCEEILTTLSQKSQYDIDSVKQIVDFLEKQEYINVKFSEDNTYCYSLLPKARIFLEQEGKKTRTKKNYLPISTYIFVMIASFIGSMLALLLFLYI